MNIGKKILSAFVEVTEEERPLVTVETKFPVVSQTASTPVAENSKFRQHFDSLFAEANLPGPDYYEFAKMVDAMTVISDEKARYLAAFAGLSVQGLNKEKLLSSAAEYLKMVETDAAAFQQTLDATLKEKVQSKQQAMDEKKERIQQLTQEITALHNELATLQNEIKENEEKIWSNNNGYKTAAENMKTKITSDIEKIKQHVS
jgi:peptidoglycan hydrolase CwlO-like protein